MGENLSPPREESLSLPQGVSQSLTRGGELDATMGGELVAVTAGELVTATGREPVAATGGELDEVSDRGFEGSRFIAFVRSEVCESDDSTRPLIWPLESRPSEALQGLGPSRPF